MIEFSFFLSRIADRSHKIYPLCPVKLKSDKLGRRRKSLYTPFYRQSYLEVSGSLMQESKLENDVIKKPSGVEGNLQLEEGRRLPIKSES